MDSSENKVFIGRQAVFNQAGEIFAYELRSNSDEGGIRPSSALLLNIIESGLEKIVGPYKAVINIDPQFLINMTPLPFDTDKIVITLPADTKIDDALSNCLEECFAEGFVMGIGDYRFDDQWTPLLVKFSFIKIDAGNLNESTVSRLQELKQHSLKLIAENISTDEQEKICREAGIDYFQGEKFARPSLVATRALAENEVIVLQLLASLNDPDVTIESLEILIQQDPTLSYKILRYINSAAIGMRQKIESIKQAVVLLGLKRIKAWATVLAMTSMKNENKDLLVNAVVRAFMCQALVDKSGTSNPDTAFTVGTLSILDVLMRTPMEKILEKLPLSDDISQALLERKGELGKALECAIAYENLDWDNASFSGCDTDCLNEVYLNSSHEGFRAVMGMEV